MAAGLYFSDPACLEHDPARSLTGAPRQPERLLEIERA